VVRALFDDALAQVLDNLGFRILAVLFVVPVLITWAFGFHDDSISVVFYWHIPYDAFVPASGGMTMPEMHTEVLDFVQKLMLDWVADKFGILFGVAAVSFFMPRLLEKGAADTVFSKPVSRFALMMSRYFAGLLFVALLSTFLVGGMYLGFRFVSGYDNKGILWGIATLTYGFAVFHAISLVIGVFTRSTVAAMLLVTIFMPVNCAVHGIWRAKELGGERIAKIRKPENMQAPVQAPKVDDDTESSSLTKFVKTGFVVTVDTLHYALPKTTDTTLIARDLRTRIENADKDYIDDDTTLTVAAVPAGFAREQRSSLNHGGLLWIARHPSGLGEAHWTLKKEKARDTGSRTAIVKALKKRLDDDPNVPATDRKSEHSDISGHPAERMQWTEKRGDESRLRRQWAFQDGEYMFTLDYDAELAWAQGEAQEHSAQVFVAGLRFADDVQANPLESDYEKRFGWHSELKYNAWFSIGSTLAFIAVVLALGWWKLSRTDF
jgi:ABC-type transport system involved in multi-copper enzyme maturation permease subunit